MKFIFHPEFKNEEDVEQTNSLDLALMAKMFDAPSFGAGETLETEFWFSDDNQLYINKYRVMYGYRIRAGYMRNLKSFSELDICCGAQKKDYDFMLERIKTIIENNPKDNPFQNIPKQSRIKPYFNDDEFLDIIENLYEKALKKDIELV